MEFVFVFVFLEQGGPFITPGTGVLRPAVEAL
jgi:hypothetical protein